MNILLQISASLLALAPFGLDRLNEDPYGFAFVDAGITDEDLATFSRVDIQQGRVYHQFGEIEMTQGVADFLTQVGDNPSPFALQTAARVIQIVNEVVQACGKETAWIHLRAFIPTDRYDLPRWHMDGSYYTPSEPNDPLLKFVVTFVGPTTLFYLLPLESRKMVERHTRNRHYMKEFCLEENTISPPLGQGAIFIGGPGFAALHSEPPIHQSRLFLSVVPCKQAQLAELKARVISVYPRDSRNEDP